MSSIENNWLVSRGSYSEIWKQLEQDSLPCSSWLEQSSEWYDFEKNSISKKPLSFVFKRQGRAIGGIRYWESRTRVGNYLTALGGPIWIPGEEYEVGEQLARGARELRRKYLFILIHTTPFYEVDLSKFGLAHLLPRGYSFIVDLTVDVDKLWKNIEKRSRGAINKATKNGLDARIAENFHDWELFYELQIEHSKKKKFENLAYDQKEIRGLYDLSLESKVALHLCFKNDKPVAAVLWFLSRKLMVLHRNAWVNEEKLNPNNLLMWHSFLWGKNHGFFKADLGGAPVPGPGVQRGIYDFKRSFGGRTVYHNRYYQGRLYGAAFKIAKQVPGIGEIVRRISRGVM